MKEDDKWVENLRNKLEDYSEPLPDALWERLEEELSAPRVIPMWRTRRFVAAAVLSFGFNILMITYASSNSTTPLTWFFLSFAAAVSNFVPNVAFPFV